MFKKIFAVFFAGMFFVAGAGAEVDARTECYNTDYGRQYRNDTDVRPLFRADYVVFFDNDKSDIPDLCKTEVETNVINELKANAKDIETVLLFGSADSTGSSQHNAELAQKRVNTVNKLLKDAGVPVCEYGNDGKPISRCAHVSMGESFDSAEANDNNSDNHLRAVFMYVIYKRDICGETASLLDELIKKIEDGDEKNKLKEVKNLCPNADTLLTQSQRNQITSAILAAVTKYPEETQGVIQESDISNTEKIRLLKDTLVYIGDEYARDVKNAPVSVWKAADGDFNYARLASDSIAGVVLGTAGGLITSKVVKKNQLKRGFENVSCTIGGQSVASYGDEFTVGFQELR